MAQHFSPRIVTDGMVLCLDAGNRESYPSSGPTWINLINDLISGSLVSSPTWSQSNLGFFSFNGTNQRTELTTSTLLQFTNTQAYTISSWVNWSVSSSSVIDAIYNYGIATSNFRGYYLSLDDSGAVGTNCVFFDYYDGTNFKGIQSSNNSVTKGMWTNVVGTCDTSNTSAGMRIYINGTAATTTTRVGAGTPSSIDYSSLTANVGSRQNSLYFTGNISLVSVYNRAITASEVLQNFNAVRGRFGI
jgi:hypothetical protein